MSHANEDESELPDFAIRGAIIVVLAVTVNIGLFLVVSTFLSVPEGFQPLNLFQVALLSAAGAAGAGAVYWVISQRAENPNQTFLRVAAGALVLSFLPDIGLLIGDPAATVQSVIVLMFMHVVVAALAVGLLVYWHREISPQES